MNKQQPKKSLLPGGGSFRGRLIIMIGAVSLLLLIAVVTFGLLSSSGDKTNENLSAIAAEQSEIVRVADLGAKSANDSTVKSAGINVSAGVASDQKDTIVFLGQQQVKLDSKQLASGKDTKVDTSLTQAKQQGSYDSTFKKILQDKLLHYQKSLKNAYDNTSSKKVKALLTNQFQHATLLLQQLS